MTSGSISRRIVGLALAIALFAGLAIGISIGGSADAPQRPEAKPKTVSLEAALAAFTTANAYFLKIPGVPGESTEATHPNEIVVQSFDWGVTGGAQTAGGTGVGKSTFADVKVTKLIDKSSPAIMKAVANGQHYATVTLTAMKKGNPALVVGILTLTEARMTSFHETGDLDNGIGESVSMAYGQIRLKYFAQSSDGQAPTVYQACWDVTKNMSTC